jgi:hypothetical protein
MPTFSKYQRIPMPGGENAQEASSVYDTFYGQMPIPATAFASSETTLASSYPPSVLAPQWESSVVNRRARRKGIISTAGRQLRDADLPQRYNPIPSSAFQFMLTGPLVDYILNNDWYIDYPAATVMNGGKHNLALSTRVDQLPTRTSGGPTAATMRSAPRFKAVQTVPRYSTMPPTYPTQPTSG